MSATATKHPRMWKFLLAGTMLLVVLIPGWTLLLMLAIQPQFLMQEPSMGRQLAWFVAAPTLLVVGLVSGSWQTAMAQARSTSEQFSSSASSKQSPATAMGEITRREYVLEVISLGITFDRYRQGKLWDALSQGQPASSIREQDPKKYPWSAREKEETEGLRAGDTLENGAKFTPTYWGVPSFYADASALDPVKRSKPVETKVGGLVAGADSSGMAWNLFIPVDWELSERPDRLLERVFAFFDANPDVPFVVLSAADGMYFRDLYDPHGEEDLIKDGYYVPKRPDASMMLVLARRDRAEAIRQYAWEEPADTGLTRKLYVAYNHLDEQFPRTPGVDGRKASVAQWLAAAHAFSQRDDVYPHGVSLLNPFRNHPPKEFKPTPWFPLPWTKYQFGLFDRLPTLGYLHRPVYVPMVDKAGHPLTRSEDRAAALAAGWQQALRTLPEAERPIAPMRIVFATGGNIEQSVALNTVINDSTAHGGLEFSRSNAARWIDTDARLGNTGAATWFMQMAIGVMGSYRNGGASMAVNLRDPAEASIVMITPPSDAKRKTQQHPEGGDVFRHHGTPAIDPSNYVN